MHEQPNQEIALAGEDLPGASAADRPRQPYSRDGPGRLAASPHELREV
jgi:hypothetical protein